MSIKRFLLAVGLILFPTMAFAQALSGLPNPGLTSSYIQMPNATSTGTTLFTLTKLTTVSSQSNAVITATTDTAGVVGIAVNGVGTSGSALIQVNGLSYCVFDGATTAGDYVTLSSSVLGNGSPIAGNCHDAGFGPPAAAPAGQVVGQVFATNAGAGTYVMRLSVHHSSRVTWTANGGAGQTSATSAYFAPFGISTASTTESATTQIISPVAGTVENLQCFLSTQQGSAKSDAFTVLSGTFGVTPLTASSITCTATNALSCSDTTHSLAVTTGQALEIKDVTTGASITARTMSCGFDLVF